jgi:hypothetical protein
MEEPQHSQAYQRLIGARRKAREEVGQTQADVGARVQTTAS